MQQVVRKVTLTEAEMPSHVHVGITLPATEDDNPDSPLNASVIGNNLSGGLVTYASGQTGAAGSGSNTITCNLLIVLAKNYQTLGGNYV